MELAMAPLNVYLSGGVAVPMQLKYPNFFATGTSSMIIPEHWILWKSSFMSSLILKKHQPVVFSSAVSVTRKHF